MKRLPRCLAALLLGGTTLNATSFDEAGHFYTAYALVRTAQPDKTPPARMLMALCAQLPDMASDLDATAVYGRLVTHSPWAWARWGLSDKTDSPDVRKMITIQQLLHALTGGDALEIQEVARTLNASLRKAAASAQGDSDVGIAACALGFGLHFYGDATAHQRMSDADKRTGRHMYGTGVGHAADLHYPDYPLCDKPADGLQVTRHCRFTSKDDFRFGAWKAIWEHAAQVYDPDDFKPEHPEARAKLIASVGALGDSANDRNHWNEDAMQVALSNGDKQVEGYRKFIEGEHSNRSCEQVLADALRTIPDMHGFTGLSCATIWTRYQTAAREAFANARVKAKAGADIGTPYDDKLYDPMPLDQ